MTITMAQAKSDLPVFSQVNTDQIIPVVKSTLAQNREGIKSIVTGMTKPGWETLVQPLDDLNDQLEQMWSPVSHMNSVVNSEALRAAYNACLPLLSEFATELGQSSDLFHAFKRLQESDEFSQLSVEQQKVVENWLRDFRLEGVDLPEQKKQRYKAIRKRLSKLTSQFSDNVLDATNAWGKLITDAELLAGVPESALAAMQQAAQVKNKKGYWLSLDFPVYFAISTYCENAALREEMYAAFVTRASDQGPHAGQWDNSQLIDEILALRHELAGLLGFESYAHYSLATKMADSPEQVMDFLTELAEHSVAAARTEFSELQDFARQSCGVAQLNPWDVSFYSEKLRLDRYDLSQEALRAYFPADHVLSGMFEIARRLYDIEITADAGVDTWHPDVKFYQITKQGQVIGRFYLDMYARDKKRGGAWMDVCRVRRRLTDGNIQLPVAYLTCNFNGPVGDDPALLTHTEVITLFHEFGHGLHHMLTQVSASGVSGINGVPWDAVELPSQFMENWCWQPDGIALISRHYKTGKVLPDEMLKKLLAVKNYQVAMQMVRQLEFSLFDLKIHWQYDPGNPSSVQSVLNQVRAEVSVLPSVSYNRFQHAFSHIFAGGYAAGYFSYKWAEVLSADAFSRFEEEGIFNAETGRAFLHNILEQGGSRDPMDLFVAFRGREPRIDALLKHTGLAKN